ncbi:MAG: hypothetical protein CL944_01475 [Candidatus Diapherotrites archaeon]|uniref:Uncharacterized protein n=1 Tax=Candidatus Iainarchaeum sp. TaxID=3101447 RepID=A0A2D6LPU4_9ARCH|nr:hypothetical protein [Candidatus Diapherotrites archaeon]|tara:strand:- start:138 stop:518 length:381 start_codon:yes stop_codon:yes gene_type:complete
MKGIIKKVLTRTSRKIADGLTRVIPRLKKMKLRVGRSYYNIYYKQRGDVLIAARLSLGLFSKTTKLADMKKFFNEFEGRVKEMGFKRIQIEANDQIHRFLIKNRPDYKLADIPESPFNLYIFQKEL